MQIGELAKSSLWEPFFPVNSDETLFHVLLLFSKHRRLKVVPIVESSNSRVAGFVTQNAVVQLLSQSSGLEWFDHIAEKAISEFGLENANRVVSVYSNQTLADALHILWEEQTDGVPVIDHRNETLMGMVRCSDIRILLENDNLFDDRKSLTVEEFIRSDAERNGKTSNRSTEKDSLCLNPRTNILITNRKSDSLKQAVENLVASKGEESFLVDEEGSLQGVVTLRDIISQFSPPSMDSRFDGGGFFLSALEQAGCHVEDGSLIRNH